MILSEVNVKSVGKMELITTKEIKLDDLVIPVGYVTNGATIPRIFWNFYPPFSPKLLPAVIVHDFLCDMAKTYEDCVNANDKFESILKDFNFEWYTVFLLPTGCRLYHWIKYKILRFEVWNGGPKYIV